jgi:mannitol-1-/sugar-/sorbitol-6-phosphatase
MRGRYRAVLCDLFGTLVDGRGNAIEGADALLQSLPPGRWAVVTSCSAQFAESLLRSARLPIPEVLVSADDVLEPKPSPAGYARAAARLGVSPPACLVIEDSTAGVAAGKAAGMDVIAIARGSRILSGADHTLGSLRFVRLACEPNSEIVLLTDE